MPVSDKPIISRCLSPCRIDSNGISDDGEDRHFVPEFSENTLSEVGVKRIRADDCSGAMFGD